MLLAYQQMLSQGEDAPVNADGALLHVLEATPLIIRDLSSLTDHRWGYLCSPINQTLLNLL